MRQHATKSLGGLLGLMIGLAACGGDDAAPKPTSASGDGQPDPAAAAGGQMPQLDPCALVTEAELEEVIGEAVAKGEPSATTAGNVTFYSCSSDDVHINIEAWTNEDDARLSYEIGSHYPPIDDMGHPARNTQPLGELDVLVGQFIVGVKLSTGMDDAGELEAAKKIARIAIDRLP